MSGNGTPSPAALLFPFLPLRQPVIPPKPSGEAEPPTRQCVPSGEAEPPTRQCVPSGEANPQLASACRQASGTLSRQCNRLLNTLLVLRTNQLVHNAFHLFCPWCWFFTESMFSDQLPPLRIPLADECKLFVSIHILYLFFTSDGRDDVWKFFEIHAVFAIVTISK